MSLTDLSTQNYVCALLDVHDDAIMWLLNRIDGDKMKDKPRVSLANLICVIYDVLPLGAILL